MVPAGEPSCWVWMGDSSGEPGGPPPLRCGVLYSCGMAAKGESRGDPSRCRPRLDMAELAESGTPLAVER